MDSEVKKPRSSRIALAAALGLLALAAGLWLIRWTSSGVLTTERALPSGLEAALALK